MKYPISIAKITTHLEYYQEVLKLYYEAAGYLKSFSWCGNILSANLYTNLGEKLCLFLFEIDNLTSKDDNFLWVIVGDIPPMYLDIHGAKSTKEVLENFVFLANEWIDHVNSGIDLTECYPFNTKPTTELANLLGRKVYFIASTVINNIDDIKIAI